MTGTGKLRSRRIFVTRNFIARAELENAELSDVTNDTQGHDVHIRLRGGWCYLAMEDAARLIFGDEENR
jgi:hypothetical protein